NAYDPVTGAYLGQLRQPNGAAIAIKGLWDMDFGEGTPDSGKTNQLFFDAGPNHPGDSTGGLFGVIRAAGNQGNLPGPQAYASIVSTSIGSSPTTPSLIMPSSSMSTTPRSLPNRMPQQQIDAIFEKVGAVSLSPGSNRTAMHAQPSGFLAMLKSNLDRL